MFEIAKRVLSRRAFIAGSAGLATAASAAGCSGRQNQEQPTRLAIIHTNDTHGHDVKNEESLGLAAVARLKQEYQNRGYEVLLFDAGDAVQGDSLVNHSKGEAGIQFLNAAGYDAMALGNHEFDFGQDALSDFVAEAEFAMLSANVIVDKTGETLVQQTTSFQLASGKKVGVFGLTTPQTQTSCNPLFVQGLTFLEGEELYSCAQAQVDALRKDGCDLVVCLGHLGEEDLCSPNRASDVATKVSGIDLLINGHDHLEETKTLQDAAGNETLIVEAECNTHMVGIVTWDGEELASQMLRVEDYDEQDSEVSELILTEKRKVDEALSAEVGATPFELNGEADPGVRTQETNLADMVCDAVLWQAEQLSDDRPVAAILNGGAIRESIAAGPIVMRDIINVLPFTNYICTVEIEGAVLLEVLEASCAGLPEAAGGFPQVAGIRYRVDTTKPYAQGKSYPQSTFKAPAKPGSRVSIAEVGGKPFKEDARYVIACSDFICNGGDSYFCFLEAAQDSMKSTNMLISDALRYLISQRYQGTVPADYEQPQGRIEIKA